MIGHTKHMFIKGALFLFVAYLFCLAGLFFFQRSILYRPDLCPKTNLVKPPAPFKEIALHSQDGYALKAWFAPPVEKKKILVFFHGNADCLINLPSLMTPYQMAGYGVLIAEYRGYSDLEGSPTEDGLYQDARAEIDEILARGFAREDLIFWGHSLGTAVATQMALEYKPAALMLLSPFSSITDMAQKRYPFFPVKILVQDHYDNLAKIKKLDLPLLIVHGTDDLVVPLDHSQKLFEAAKEPKSFKIINHAGHSNIFEDFSFVAMAWIKKVL